MSAAKFNMRNPAVKRIMQEIKEMQSERSTDFIADALEDDIFEWHFVVRGPPDTEFEDFTKDERKKLALISRTEVPKFGSQARQKVISDMHQRMLKLQQQAIAPACNSASQDTAEVLDPATPETVPLARYASLDAAPAAAGYTDQNSSKQQQQHKHLVQQIQQSKFSELQVDAMPQQQQSQQQDAQCSAVQDQSSSRTSSVIQQQAAAATSAVHYVTAEDQALHLQRAVAAGSRPGDLGDKGLTFLAVVLSVAIAAVLLKKVMTAMSGYRLFVDL